MQTSKKTAVVEHSMSHILEGGKLSMFACLTSKEFMSTDGFVLIQIWMFLEHTEWLLYFYNLNTGH